MHLEWGNLKFEVTYSMNKICHDICDTNYLKIENFINEKQVMCVIYKKCPKKIVAHNMDPQTHVQSHT